MEPTSVLPASSALPATSAPAILFVCTGNTCRSQMAQAMLRALAPGLTVYSAGVAPGLQISANAELVLHAAGYSAEGLYPKHIREYFDSSGNSAGNPQAPTLVFTLCENARKQLPALPAHILHVHHSFTDPYHATGSRAERAAVYEHVRASIEDWLRGKVLPMLQVGKDLVDEIQVGEDNE